MCVMHACGAAEGRDGSYRHVAACCYSALASAATRLYSARMHSVVATLLFIAYAAAQSNKSAASTKERPAAAPPAWDTDADDLLVEGFLPLFGAIVVIGVVRLLVEWWARQ